MATVYLYKLGEGVVDLNSDRMTMCPFPGGDFSCVVKKNVYVRASMKECLQLMHEKMSNDDQNDHHYFQVVLETQPEFVINKIKVDSNSVTLL